jgi:hypothetical protein
MEVFILILSLRGGSHWTILENINNFSLILIEILYIEQVDQNHLEQVYLEQQKITIILIV